MKQLSLLFLILLFSACGSVSSVSLGDTDASVSSGPAEVYFFGTDFASSGQLYESAADGSGFGNTGVTNLGSSAVMRFFSSLLYILHDGFSIASSDNVQILDPSDSLSTVNQFSTGNGTNPHDIVVVGSTAFISLYNASGDSDNTDSSGNPGDVIVMDLDTGEISTRLSFNDFLNDDDFKAARADQMVLVGNLLYVCLQDLAEDFSPDAAGKIGVINVSTLQIVEVIELQGRNPVDIVYSETENKLFVANQAPFNSGLGNFDTSTAFGGIEIVPVDDSDNTTLIADEDLGGYVERLALGGGKLLAVVSQMDSTTFVFTSNILAMDESGEASSDLSTLIVGSSDARELAVDSQEQVWVSWRDITAESGSATDPQIEIYNLSTGDSTGTVLEPDVPVSSIVF